MSSAPPTTSVGASIRPHNPTRSGRAAIPRCAPITPAGVATPVMARSASTTSGRSFNDCWESCWPGQSSVRNEVPSAITRSAIAVRFSRAASLSAVALVSNSIRADSRSPNRSANASAA